jgi:hypothetical protein
MVACTQSLLFRAISFIVKVTRSVNTSAKELSPQEEQTIQSIVNAR